MSSLKAFEPKLITVLKEGYSFKTFTGDLWAGIVVGIIALPLSIAFAIASGVKPEQGLITAFIAGFIISLFSGSRVQIGGPTGAFIVIIFNIVQKFGYEGLATATFMAGILLILIGLVKLGDVIKFIPYPVTIGFTSGIALIIFTTQIKDFLGLPIEHLPEHFFDKWVIFFTVAHSINFYSLILSVSTISLLAFWPKITKKIPAALIAIVLTTIIVQFFHWPVDTIATRFHEVSAVIPKPAFPRFDMDILIQLWPSALSIALLAGIESLLSAVVADGMTGSRHRSNMELIAQGMANIISPLFGGIPATGAIARTAANIKNGGKTPVAGMVHAVTILIIFLFLGKWAALIPMATLAGILIVVAYNMSEWRFFIKLFKGPREDVFVLIITFFLTIFVDLTVAIEVGIVLAAFLFMKRMIAVTEVGFITDQLEEENDDPESMLNRSVPEGVEVFEINGPFFFGATDKFKDALSQIQQKPKILILRLRHVPTIDATGLQALNDVFRKAKKDGTKIIISAARPAVLKIIHNTQSFSALEPQNITEDIDQALRRAQELLSGIK